VELPHPDVLILHYDLDPRRSVGNPLCYFRWLAKGTYHTDTVCWGSVIA